MPHIARRLPRFLQERRPPRARRAASIDAGQYHGGLFAQVSSGITVTPQSSLANTAVYSAINLISTDVAKLPRQVKKRWRDGHVDLEPRHPVNRLLRAPNREMTADRFWRCLMGHVLGWGNGYAEIVRDGDGNPTELWPLDPGQVEPRRTDTRALYYQDKSTGRRFWPESILHVAGLGFDGLTGYSPITYGKQAVGLAIAAEVFGGSFFGNSAVPKGILKTPKRLTETAARRLRESFYGTHGGAANAHKPAVLEEGLEWQDTQISPEAAQFLATRQFQVIEIARMFNLPPNKLMDYTQAHHANMEESNQDYLDTTLAGWLSAIESEVQAKLFFESEQDTHFVEHDTSRLLRGNSQARTARLKELRGMGVVNADTIAAAEGLPLPGPENGGQLYLVQSQNVPVQMAGQVTKPSRQPAPADPPPDPEPAQDPADPPPDAPKEAESA